MKKMKSIFTNIELLMDITTSQRDETLQDLGFKYFKPLNECEGFKDTPYRVHVCYKPISEDECYIIAFNDKMNGYSSLLYTDVPIKEILKLEKL